MRGSTHGILVAALPLLVGGCVQTSNLLLEKADLHGAWTWTREATEGELGPPVELRWAIDRDFLVGVTDLGCDGAPVDCGELSFRIVDHVPAQDAEPCLFGPDECEDVWYTRAYAEVDWSETLLDDPSLIELSIAEPIRLDAEQRGDPLAQAERDPDGSLRAFAVLARYREAGCGDCEARSVVHRFVRSP